MSARYLIRLDDACHTMDTFKWDKIENILDKYSVKPIVSVIPDNKDRSLESLLVFKKRLDSTFKKDQLLLQIN